MGKVQKDFIFRITGLILLFFFFLHSDVFSQEKIGNEYLKKYYSVADGLSQSEVTSIIQDKYGFMWMGTRGGLNRFNGYDFLQFKPESGTLKGLLNPSIETLHTDKNGNIWIGTKSGGLGIYNILKNEFVDIDSLSNRLPNRIITLYEDREGNYWIGSWNSGVYKYNPENGEVTRYIENFRVSSIIQTQDGTIWFGTSSGLRYKKPDNEQIFSYNMGQGFIEITEMLEAPEDSSLWLVGWNVGLRKFNYQNFTQVVYDLAGKDSQEMTCHSLLKDMKGYIWVGTWGNGLFRSKSDSDSFEEVFAGSDFSDIKNRELDVILDLFEDSAGDVWVGTDGGGVVRLSDDRKFNTILSSNNEEIGPWHVNAVETSSDGRLWIGTRSNGLYVSADKLSFESVGFGKDNPNYGSNSFMVKSIDLDESGQVWVGLETGLFLVVETEAGVKELVNAASFFESAELRAVRKVLKIKRRGNNLWVATQQNGLYWFVKKAEQYHLKRRFYSGDQTNTFQDNRISTLKYDESDNLWIGTYKGLYRFDLQDSIPVLVNSFLDNNQNFLCDIILSCNVDSLNRVWVGTPCSLNSLTPNKNGNYTLKEYTQKDGMTDDYINSIQTSEKYIWISTNAGISRFCPEQEDFRNYDVSDGVGGYNFAESSYARDDDGIIYFGGYSDLTYFDPAGLEENKVKPPIVITDFSVMNKQVAVAEDGILPVSINEAENITLNYKQKEFSFEIAALDYKSPENNQYAYRLIDENGDGDWVYIGQRRHISFSNLKSGDYKLQLAGSNSNGVWNRDGRSLAITILPPPWETWYAFGIYLIVLLGIVTMINRVSMRQERLKNQARIEHVNRIQEHELNEYKLGFFTDISHELKTPLTLIQGPVEELRNKDLSSMSSTFLNKRLDLVHNSVVKLLDLLNQLLEFRKVEVGHTRLSCARLDIVSFVSSICGAYESSAQRQGIEFNTDIRVKKTNVWFDPAKMDIVINNLLANAFKYSGTPGKVKLVLTESDNEVILTVSNNGKNIPDKDIHKLFDKFYQSSGRFRQSGYGIGLFLVKKFVDLHKGQVGVESHPGGMTTFTVRLLKGDNHLVEEEKNPEPLIMEGDNVIRSLQGDAGEVMPKIPQEVKGKKVLVVEDNPEVRGYITDLLDDHFDVITAEDGFSGYDATIEHLPDLVLSDVMMPLSDGYELCARVKKNENTSHIPVILLTAKDKAGDYVTGTRKGADAYLTKPFDPVLLLEKIKQLISSRAVLAEKYKRKLTLDPVNKEITSDDEKMIKCVIRVIEKHAENPELDSDFVAAEMGMSISTFYRRMKKVVNKTPGEFIKTIRLKLAARYLKETNLAVSEIVEKVGYSDIRNFRKSFKNEFDLSPGDYRKSVTG